MEKTKKYLEGDKLWLLFLIGAGVLIDIFILDSPLDLVLLFLTGLWILTVWLNHFESRISIVGGLLFLVICPFLLIFGLELFAEKTAIWAFIFLAVGVGQFFIESLKEERRNAKREKK